MDPLETEALGPAFATALARKGYTALTPVQSAVLDPELANRDLRISSQTGSGKTVAIGLGLRDVLQGDASATAGVARPRALVLVPTRELAKQVDEELAWLLAPLGARVACVTGGSSYRTEHRLLAAGPAIVVGTPGRLLDHLGKGAIDPSGLGAVVLDEADRMLDMGFREDIEAVLALAPSERRTHLVSATFPREVLALADRVQRDPASVEGTPLGAANADIDHVVYLVHPGERLAAIVNLLLASPGTQTLLFVRTRSDVTELSDLLLEAGFRVRGLSGELEQRERERALAAFKRGDLDALVATDVAARGIDVQDVSRVLHAELPGDADAYTHRSGRTGRAGRKGTSALLVPPPGLTRAMLLLRRAGVRARIDPVPTAEELRAARDARRFAQLSAEPGAAGEAASGGRDRTEGDFEERSDPGSPAWALAEQLITAGHATRALARLLAGQSARPAPRHVTPVAPPAQARRARDVEPARATRKPRREEGGWIAFRVTWGEVHGADPRRLLAMLCRRGDIRREDVGAISVQRTHSIVQIAPSVAGAFALAAGTPDPRDHRVTIRPVADGPFERDRAPRTVPPPAPRRPRPAARSRPGRDDDAPPNEPPPPASDVRSTTDASGTPTAPQAPPPETVPKTPPARSHPARAKVPSELRHEAPAARGHHRSEAPAPHKPRRDAASAGPPRPRRDDGSRPPFRARRDDAPGAPTFRARRDDAPGAPTFRARRDDAAAPHKARRDPGSAAPPRARRDDAPRPHKAGSAAPPRPRRDGAPAPHAPRRDDGSAPPRKRVHEAVPPARRRGPR